MDVTVILNEPAEFVPGSPSERVTFTAPDIEYTSEDGDLHVWSKSRGKLGMIPHGQFRAVVRGGLAVQASPGATKVSQS